MKEQIIEYLKNEKQAVSIEKLEELTNVETADDLKNLLKVLNELEDEYKITRTKKNNYMIFDDTNFRVGTLSVNAKKFGFVDISKDESYYIDKRNMNDAIHGDTVVMEIINPEKREAKVIKVLNRSVKQVVGEFVYRKNRCFLILDDDKLNIKIDIDKDKTMGAMDGHKVLVKIINHKKDDIYKGEVIKILGHKNDPGIDILSIVASLGISDTFSQELLEEVEKLPYEVSEDEIKGRVDLRDRMIFTIDGDDTKDIDDAISITKLENDNYMLGVHIADVSHYVKEDSLIEKEAYTRGTSVYLADRVIPMLPHKLSNGICSLNPEVDRLTLSCEMEIDPNGKIVDKKIFESVIRSRKQMTYKNVNKILEENIIPEGYEEYVPYLRMMKDLAKILRTEKINRGYIEFDIDEAKIVVDDNGTAIDVVRRYRGVGENLIEDFMIAANEAVASTIYYMDLPFVYRIHGEPSPEKIQNFVKLLKMLGYKLTQKVDKVTPKVVQEIIKDLKDKKEFYVLSSLLLRSMQKAIYDPNNIGHFGLASDCYTHFTSPIRRYPDLTVHRLLRKYLFLHKIDMDTVTYYENTLPSLTNDASEAEQNSIECERQVDDMKMAEYMLNHIGEEFDGIITGTTNFGMFVILDNLVEGLVRIDSLVNDRYFYDEETLSLVGSKDKRGYRLGDNVRIIVVAASKEKRTVDFEVVDNRKVEE